MIEADAYGVLRNLLSPQRPRDKSFHELKEVLIGHYSPKPILIAERFKFHRRNQLESESVAQFIVELEQLALKCEFGVFLEEALRDRLVCGLKNIQIRKKLLAERELIFKKAFETAQSMELANKEDIRDVIMAGDESVNKVDKVATPRRSQGKSGSFFRCGRKHAPSECCCKTARCYRCKKRVILPSCAIRNVILILGDPGAVSGGGKKALRARVMLRMFRSQIVLLMKCVFLGCVLSPLQISVDRFIKSSCCWRANQSEWK